MNDMQAQSPTTNRRILAIDILRGMTVCGMILVNNPGSWSHIYAPLRHAQWNGLTPTDLVFPFFMFIMGLSMYISLGRYDYRPSTAAWKKIVRRTVGIYLVGIFVGWFSRFCRYWVGADPDVDFLTRLWEACNNFSSMRITGVLARLAVCYGISSALILCLRPRQLKMLVVLLLVGYGILLLTCDGYIYGPENLLGRVDLAVLTDAHMYHDNGIDPEGLLSTLPAIAHVLIGFLVGRMLFRKHDGVRPAPSSPEFPLTELFVVGALLTFSGLLLDYGLPINKKVWSPTFVLATCGLASTLLGLLIYVIDIRGYKRWSRFFEVFGVNPLFLYALSGVLGILLGCIRVPMGEGTMSLHGIVYSKCLVPVLGDTAGSLAYALLFILLNWSIGYILYRRHIYIKL